MFFKYTLAILAVVAAYPSFLSAQAPELLTIDEVTTPIRVDGHLDDWPNTRLFYLHLKSQVTSGLSFWRSADNFSGRIFVTYDKGNLYLSAVVTKSVGIVNDGNQLSLLNGDCVELLISTGQTAKRRGHLTRGDYHLGFSPGTDCKTPSLYCFNLDKEVTGGRIVSRKTNQGYVLEAAVPLSFLEGLDLGPGKKAYLDIALDEGGSISGNRLLRMDLALDDFSASHPAKWAEIYWIGKDSVSVPFMEGGDINGDLVLDGTAGDTYRGSHPVTGFVRDELGRPLAGAVVSTWPRTKECSTDAAGRFVFDKIKLFDHTVAYARLDGYFTSLAPCEKNEPLTVTLKALPLDLEPQSGRVSGLFFGLSPQTGPGGKLLPMIADSAESLKTLQLHFLDYSGLDPLTQTLEEMKERLDLFVSYCGQAGCRPMIRLPLPYLKAKDAAELVAHARTAYPGQVEYWTLGNEPDRLEGINDDPDQSPFNVYRYINEFREAYNAMKLADPAIVILGPELATKYGHGNNDWLTPFLRYDGDIVNMASIHRHAVEYASQAESKAVLKALRDEPALIRGLEDRVDVNTDVTVPLVVTGANVFSNPASIVLSPTATATPVKGTPTPVRKPGTPTPTPTPTPRYGTIWPALWAAQETGVLFAGGVPMAHFDAFPSQEGSVSPVSGDPGPLYWALKMMSPHLKGRVLSAQTRMPNLSVFACEDGDTRTVNLILVNAGDRYLHPKIGLKGEDEDVSVVSDLSLLPDFEIPEYGIVRLTLRDGGKPCESEVYFYRSTLEGKPPVVKEVHF